MSRRRKPPDESPSLSDRMDAPTLDDGRFVHIVEERGKLTWSGHNATGDPSGNGAATFIIEVPGDEDYRHIGDDGRMVLSKIDKLNGFRPEGLLIAARQGMWGIRLVKGP